MQLSSGDRGSSDSDSYHIPQMPQRAQDVTGLSSGRLSAQLGPALSIHSPHLSADMVAGQFRFKCRQMDPTI